MWNHFCTERSTKEGLVNIDQYRRQLLTLERELSARLEATVASARELTDELVTDPGADEILGELKEEEYSVAQVDWTRLRQVREALQRVEDGTFGLCVVDGKPIEEKRLEAMPWTAYCLKHQQELESAESEKTPTL
jgi:DnaK suppressor protein